MCGVSQLSGPACPSECPFWAPSAIWKHVGVCSKAQDCNNFNPMLHYADQNRNVCLPCQVFGCVSCEYRETFDSIGFIARGLPDYCIECAKGYKRSPDGKMCYLIHTSWWSFLFFALCALIIAYLLFSAIRLLLKRKEWRENWANLTAGLENQKDKMLKKNGKLYSLDVDVAKENISGIGLMLYFRNLKFLTLTMAFLFVISLAHTHIPFSGMIRRVGKDFGLDDGMLNYGMDDSGHNGQDSHSAGRPPSIPLNTGLHLDIFNLGSVDDAVEWNLTRYSREVSEIIHIAYILIMALTIVYMVSQRRIIRRNIPQWKHLTLVLKGLPRETTNEETISAIVYDATGIRPHSITICYDIRRCKGHDEYIGNDEHVGNVDDLGHYINLDKLQGYDMENLQGTGQALVTFHSRDSKTEALHRFNHHSLRLQEFNVDPEKVIWENIGYENDNRMGATVATVLLSLTVWSIAFFMPYAAYSMHTTMSHILEILVINGFVELGSSLVSISLDYTVRQFNLVNKDVADGYIMCSNYFIKLINLALNIMLAHLNNYGGRNKLFAIIKGEHLNTPSFRMGEEVSFSLSFSMYMVNAMVVMPAFLFILGSYILPLAKSLVVLLHPYDREEACTILEYPTIDLANWYATDLVNFTSCLLLLFIVKGRRQSLFTFLALFGSYFLNYWLAKFVVLRKSSRECYNTWSTEYFAMILWAFPTAIVAACPSYWKWRSGEATLFRIASSITFHFAIYYSIMYIIFLGIGGSFIPARGAIGSFIQQIYEEVYRKDITADNITESHYKSYNPVYKFKV